VTAVRPATDDENGTQNIWQRDGDEIVLRDASGTEHIRLPSLGKLSKDRVPAIYSYDHAADEYVVYEHGEQHIYETKSAFEDDWVRIKKPFVPEDEFSAPEYSRDSYVIVILADEGSSVVYTNETTKPLATLLNHSTAHEGSEGDSENDDENSHQAEDDYQEDSAPGEDIYREDSSKRNTQTDGSEPDHETEDFESFVDVYVTEDEDAELPKDDLYNAYRIWAIRHDNEVQSKAWFSRSLGEVVTYDTSRIRQNGSRVNCYTGISLTAAGKQLIE